MSELNFSFGGTFDAIQFAPILKASGRVEIPLFISLKQAEALRGHLLRRSDWALVVNAGSKVFDIPRAAAASFTPEQQREFDLRLSAAARSDFQFCYESVRVPDVLHQPVSLLEKFVAFMGSSEACDFFNALLGVDDIAYADGQATAYGRGHFLTRHDDDVAGLNRRAAYVLGLSPEWRAEWGGLLMFHRADGNIDEAFTPAMATLRLFTVPAVHSVSYVTPFAPEPRLSVTGWLRTRRPSAA